MPSTNMPNTLPELMALRSEIETRITAIMSGGGGSIVASGGSSKAVKKTAAKRSSGPSAWGDWTKHVVEGNKQELEKFKAEQATKQGAHLKWMGAGGPGSERFGKDSDAWKGFKAEWDASHPKQSKQSVSSGASTASSDSEEASSAEKKRRGPKKLTEMTEEERAAHDAKKKEKREAKNKDAEAAATGAELGRTSQPSLTPIPEESQVTFAGDDEEVSVELLPFVLDGTKYVRMGTKSADSTEPVWASGDLWYFKKAAVDNKGDYVGRVDEDGTIDTDAEEPELD